MAYSLCQENIQIVNYSFLSMQLTLAFMIIHSTKKIIALILSLNYYFPVHLAKNFYS